MWCGGGGGGGGRRGRRGRGRHFSRYRRHGELLAYVRINRTKSACSRLASGKLPTIKSLPGFDLSRRSRHGGVPRNTRISPLRCAATR